MSRRKFPDNNLLLHATKVARWMQQQQGLDVSMYVRRKDKMPMISVHTSADESYSIPAGHSPSMAPIPLQEIEYELRRLIDEGGSSILKGRRAKAPDPRVEIWIDGTGSMHRIQYAHGSWGIYGGMPHYGYPTLMSARNAARALGMRLFDVKPMGGTRQPGLAYSFTCKGSTYGVRIERDARDYAVIYRKGTEQFAIRYDRIPERETVIADARGIICGRDLQRATPIRNHSNTYSKGGF